MSNAQDSVADAAVVDMREALRQCYVELHYCAQQLEARKLKCPAGGSVRRALTLGKTALASPAPATGGTVDAAMVDPIGAALYVYWNDVNERARNAYRKKIRAALEAAIAAPDRAPGGDAQRVEVRRDETGDVDEVVGYGHFHLEQMDAGHWWLGLGESEVFVNLTARGRIKATAEKLHPQAAEQGERGAE